MADPGLVDDVQTASLAAALGTQYTLVRVLGRGGMGVVYLALEPFLDRYVAVKVLPADLATGDARERFLREARTAAKLSHANIVPLYTFGQAGDVLYFVMGYVEGESLESRLRREGRLPFDDARRIIGELASALDYAHQLGVVHRDMKPDNVLLDRRTGRAMLTDFGIAKQRANAETLTATGLIMGTPHYMSPEQATAEREIDGRSDIYSLGVIGYRLISGRLPFEGTQQAVLTQHVTRAAEPLSKIVPDVPVGLGNAVLRALAKDPAERWQSARGLRDAVQGVGEESMPEELRDISRVGVRMSLLTLGFLEVGVMGSVLTENWWSALFICGASSLIPILAWLGTIRLSRRFGRRETMRAWLLKPTWWAGWWPRLGRAEGDVWDRLPTLLRRMRIANSVLIVLLPVMLNALVAIAKIASDSPVLFTRSFAALMVAYFAVLGLAAVPTIAYRKWTKAIGLSARETGHLADRSTADRAFWAQPHIAALLSPPGSMPSLRGERTASEIVGEIERFAAGPEETRASELGEAAAVAARKLGAAIAWCDDELAQLARDADPAQRARIMASVDALGTARTDESTPKQQMRELLGKQLALFREVDQRRVVVSERRDQLLEQLRTLALHLANLRAQTAVDPAQTAEITAQVRAVVNGIDYQLTGMREVRELLDTR